MVQSSYPDVTGATISEEVVDFAETKADALHELHCDLHAETITTHEFTTAVMDLFESASSDVEWYADHGNREVVGLAPSSVDRAPPTTVTRSS